VIRQGIAKRGKGGPSLSAGYNRQAKTGFKYHQLKSFVTRPRFGWLARRSDSRGGHAVAKHIGVSNIRLRNRLLFSKVPAATTFTSKKVAQRAIKNAIKANQSEIKKWLRSEGKNTKTIYATRTKPVGRGYIRGQKGIQNIHGTKIVLRRDKKGGYRIQTAYPEKLATTHLKARNRKGSKKPVRLKTPLNTDRK
jgi:hypothetical protein